MTSRVGVFWPGDYRAKPNADALPQMEAATVQLEKALRKLGRTPYRIEGYLTKPHESIEKLGPVDDPLVGVYVHWVYGPHTTDGVVGKDSRRCCWPATSREPGRGWLGCSTPGPAWKASGRTFSRAWTDAELRLDGR